MPGLSESSLFVFPCKVILKTCGTTTLLHALDRLLAVGRDCGLVAVTHACYSRKNFLEPARQVHPHGNLLHEAEVLEQHFPSGKAHVLGRLNGDHWCLYVAEQPVPRELPLPAPDHTLEVLMHDMDPTAMRHFYRGKHFVSSKVATTASGIADLVPGAAIDELVFSPCGYSANGLLDESYFTIHVTPQSYCSFASFETNVPQHEYTALINRVVAVFRPRRFQVTLFVNETSLCGRSIDGYNANKITGFRRSDVVFQQFEHCDLTFAQFVRQTQ